jgi:hypothetical protein
VRSMPGEEEQVDAVVKAGLAELVGVVRSVVVAQHQTGGDGSRRTARDGHVARSGS